MDIKNNSKTDDNLKQQQMFNKIFTKPNINSNNGLINNSNNNQSSSNNNV